MHIHKLHRILRYHCAVSTAVIVRRNKIRICTCTLLIKILLIAETEPAGEVPVKLAGLDLTCVQLTQAMQVKS